MSPHRSTQVLVLMILTHGTMQERLEARNCNASNDCKHRCPCNLWKHADLVYIFYINFRLWPQVDIYHIAFRPVGNSGPVRSRCSVITTCSASPSSAAFNSCAVAALTASASSAALAAGAQASIAPASSSHTSEWPARHRAQDAGGHDELIRQGNSK